MLLGVEKGDTSADLEKLLNKTLIKYSFIRSPLINEDNRRYSQLATVLRAHTLMDIDCWSTVPGHPLQPGTIRNVIDSRLEEMEGAETCSA